VDVYNPTTGELRPGSTEDIAMWMIDTVVVDADAFSRLAFSSAAPHFARHLDGQVPTLSFATWPRELPAAGRQLSRRRH
jgi:hypothetical protein